MNVQYNPLPTEIVSNIVTLAERKKYLLSEEGSDTTFTLLDTRHPWGFVTAFKFTLCSHVYVDGGSKYPCISLRDLSHPMIVGYTKEYRVLLDVLIRQCERNQVPLTVTLTEGSQEKAVLLLQFLGFERTGNLKLSGLKSDQEWIFKP